MLRLSLAFLVLLALPAWAQDAHIRLLEYGVICDIETQGSRPAPLTESGVLHYIDQTREIDVATAAVPARKGLSFGIRIVLAAGATSDATRIVVTHPPMGKRGVTVESWSTRLTPGVPNLNLFTFEYDYEQVEGRWSFAVVDHSGKVLEQHFDVLPAVSVPAVQEACFDPELLS